jgi:hypothetical protein
MSSCLMIVDNDRWIIECRASAHKDLTQRQWMSYLEGQNQLLDLRPVQAL